MAGFMDTLDQDILDALTRDARTPVSTLARRLGQARTTIAARIERLERDGAILGYTIRRGAARTAIRATALIHIEPRSAPAVLQRLKAVPEVAKVATTSGRFDMIVEIAAPDTRRLDDILDLIGEVKGVISSESLIELSVKIDRR
jgi:DNA-binding Lrp family transcriptional regulator